jgi:hypothetical protein
MKAGVVWNFSTQGKVRTKSSRRPDDALDRRMSGWFDMSSGQLALLTDGSPDGMTRSPDGWQGTGFSNLQTMQNLLEALLNSGIPVKKHPYKEVILSNKMWPITN